LINQSKTNGNDKENALKYLKEMRKLWKILLEKQYLLRE
jgi:hypothetical protein